MPPDTLASRVGDTVRAEMARRRITQASMADALGMTQPALSRRISGHVPFAVDELATVASMLGIPVGELIPADAA